MIHMGRHFACPLWSPRPDGRCNVMNHANIALRAHQLGDAQAEIWAVDCDQDIRLSRQNCICRFANACFESAVLWQDLGQSHHAQLVHRELTDQTLRLHQWATDACKTNIGLQCLQAIHQSTAQLIARYLTCDHKHLHAASLTHRNMPCSSSSAITASRSRTMTPPASITMPSNPASAA